MVASSVSTGKQAEIPASTTARPHSERALVELIDRILDKGLVNDAWTHVSVLGIELITIEARIVVASLEMYLRYAEAITAVPLVARPPALPERRAQAPAGQQPLPQPPSTDAAAPHAAQQRGERT